MVNNGSFEVQDITGKPKDWRTAGHPGIAQIVESDAGPPGKRVPLKLPPGVSTVDLMGNRLEGRDIEVTEVPIYVLTKNDETLIGLLK